MPALSRIKWKPFVRLAAKRKRFFKVNGRLADTVAELSGGNVQRLVLARELSRACGLIVTHNPMAGLDRAGENTSQALLRTAVQEGAGLVWIGDEPQMSETDGVLYLFQGHQLSPMTQPQNPPGGIPLP